MTYKFEKLEVWTKSKESLKNIYILCNKMPKSEERNLIDQLRRSATSILLNIAEGSGAENDTEFKRYLQISRKSHLEWVAILLLIQDLYGFDIEKELAQLEEIGKMLHGLVQYLSSEAKSTKLSK